MSRATKHDTIELTNQYTYLGVVLSEHLDLGDICSIYIICYMVGYFVLRRRKNVGGVPGDVFTKL